MKNLYVGNLQFQSTEQELQAAFATYGQVSKVTMVTDRDTGQPRGFAFVEMNDDAEAAKAIAGLDGSSLGGRAIKVNEAHPKTPGGSSRGGGGSRRY
jgi:cold-inducible RNA-binding protein